MNPHRLIAFVVALALATPAVAADVVEPGGGMAQTAYVKATERTSRGKLDACEMEYRVIFEDYTYRRGAVSVLHGCGCVYGFHG